VVPVSGSGRVSFFAFKSSIVHEPAL
jgi:hypothetical protein